MILLKNRDRNPSFKKGEYVEINDAGNYPMELSVDGVCEQVVTTGTNLCDLNVTQNNKVVYNSDGTITINGSGGFTLAFKQFTAKANTKYYMKWELLSGTVDTSKSNGNSFLNPLDSTNIKQDEFKKSVVENDKNINGFWINNQTVFTNAVIRIWVSETQSPFEPYTGNQPSPSPNFPQEIKTLTGDIKLTSCGKNLFDSSFRKANGTLTVAHGTGAEINGIFTLKATDADIYLFDLLGPSFFYNEGCGPLIEIPKSNSGKLFFKNTNSLFTKNYITQYDKNKKSLGASYISSNVGYVTIKSNAKYCSVKTGYSKSVANEEYKFSILLSTNDISYEPYQGSSLNITIPENEFVGRIDDTYKDTLNVVYKEDGHYHLMLNKMIGKVVLDGSETFYINAHAQTLGYNIFVYKGLITSLANGDNSCKSNYFIHYSWGQFDSKDAIYQNSNWIMFKCDSLNIGNDIDKFKEWLSTHNIEVYYPLATHYEVDLGIVDTLLSYDEITNIFSDSDLYPVINAKYYKDFEFDKILRSGYNIDEQEYEIAKKQMANGKRKRILSSYDDCIIKINLGLLDNKTYQEYKEQLDDGEFHYWSYKYNQYKKANFILTKPSITTEYAYDDDIGIDDIEITLEKSSDVS